MSTFCSKAAGFKRGLNSRKRNCALPGMTGVNHGGKHIGRWQDIVYPGEGRPFRLHEYVNENSVWLSDSREGGAKLKVSRDYMEAQIEMARLLSEYESLLKKVEQRVAVMKKTGNAQVRGALAKQVRQLERQGAEILGELDKIEEP